MMMMMMMMMMMIIDDEDARPWSVVLVHEQSVTDAFKKVLREGQVLHHRSEPR